MRKSAILGVVMLLWAGQMVFGQASLPTSHSGPWKVGPLPTGWTQTGLDTDYKTDYDSSGGNAAKFNDAGDFIQIFFSSAPSAVSYYSQANSLVAGYVFKVQESVNGSTWTDVSTFTSTNNPIPSAVTQHTNNLLSSSRYVRFIFVTDMGGGIGIDGVRIAGPGVPSVSFNPAGSTNTPASNLFTMAVAITPSGAGMQSWSMAPAYVGPASLTGGTFTFTPANSDSNKTFTVSVIATNSVGTTTGTATIAVTAYVPPVPVITFSPTGTYSIMATETQKLGIGVTPAGSGIQGWTLLPSNYAGSASLVGTNFTFIPAEADGPSNYVLSIFATNVFGTTTGTASIAVLEYIAPPPPGSVVVIFDDGPAKTGYAMETNTLSGRQWLVGGVLGELAGDKRYLDSGKALRLRGNPGDNPIKLSSQTPFANGIDSIGLWFASYGTDGTNNMPQVSIQISTNLDADWITLDTFDTGAATSLVYRVNEVKVKVPVYFRLWAPEAGEDNRANIDNIVIAPYVAATGYNAFLLQYNVTPGDPGTAPDEDLDGDLVTNTNEYNAGTNPYDEAIHP